MRKISYTQMRAELSDILDAIRNGETIVVTQRGRPDTLLNGALFEENTEGSNSILKSYIVHKGKRITPKKGNYFKISFNEALSKTKLKHAKIIKALEDK